MKVTLGPIPREKIILCSADAGPNAQRSRPERADYFFPRASWVGAVRNVAENLRCRFFILTTGHGFVDSYDIIEPYDLHIIPHKKEVSDKWRMTIPKLIGQNNYNMMLFYAGGCPKGLYLELLLPLLEQVRVSLITFGRPNMRDSNNIQNVASQLIRGTSIREISSVLSEPDRLEVYFYL